METANAVFDFNRQPHDLYPACKSRLPVTIYPTKVNPPKAQHIFQSSQEDSCLML